MSKSPMKTDNSGAKAPLSAKDQVATDTDDEEADQADDGAAAKAAPRKIEAPAKIWRAPRTAIDTKVKRVLMPIPARTEQTSTTKAKVSVLPVVTAVQRPRRVTTVQP